MLRGVHVWNRMKAIVIIDTYDSYGYRKPP